MQGYWYIKYRTLAIFRSYMKNDKFRFIVFCLITVFSLYTYGQQIKVSGIVFEDKNKNGIKDTSEKGIKNIPVSNGEDIVLTDKNGAYSISTLLGSSVFTIPPSQYKTIGREDSKIMNTAHLYIDTLYRTTEAIKFDIPLIPQSKKKEFRIGAIGDIQMKDHQEINYANQSVIAELMERHDIDFNIFLGDQINETLSLLPTVNKMIDALPMPSWTVLGNHDRNTKGSVFQDDEFNRHLGASHYAFNYGDIHFIVLNNVFSKGGREYSGFISEKQLNFVKNDLKYISPNSTIVICQHIPMVHTRNKESILELVKNYPKVLILSGHTHQISRHILAPNIHELVAGASCGNWWVGERDWMAIPTALMQCGSPRNYFTVDFEKNTYKINYKGIGLSADKQMDIWISGQDSIDNHIDALTQLDKNLVVVNIYGGSDSTKVVMQIDNGENIEMLKTPMISPAVSRLIYMNNKKAYPTLFSRRGALRKKNSPHIWVGTLPSDLSTGIHSIRIYASDEYGFEVTNSKLFINPHF